MQSPRVTTRKFQTDERKTKAAAGRVARVAQSILILPQARGVKKPNRAETVKVRLVNQRFDDSVGIDHVFPGLLSRRAVDI